MSTRLVLLMWCSSLECHATLLGGGSAADKERLRAIARAVRDGRRNILDGMGRANAVASTDARSGDFGVRRVRPNAARAHAHAL